MTTEEMLAGFWPEWHIEKQLGKGAYGVVYEAVRNDFAGESRAAIKVIRIPENESEVDSLRADGLTIDDTRAYLSGIVNDFVGEIQLMDTFKGVQNIVSVEDYKVVENPDKIGWTIFIRMELLTPLNVYIGDFPMPEKAVAQLGIDMCSALEICERQHVIHRDIKPENIFVNQYGDYKLGDFGVARRLENLAGGLSKKGTYNYMAPEIEKGANYDQTVDIYSLGLVLYRFLNRRMLPFLTPETQMSPNERMNAVQRRLSGEALPAPVDASAGMAEIILRACAFEPSRRFQNPREMKKALNAIINDSYVPGSAAATPAPAQTQTMAADSLDKTMSVRHAPAAGTEQAVNGSVPPQPVYQQQTPPQPLNADSLNKTMSVRHAPPAGNEQAVKGNVPPQPAYQQQTPQPSLNADSLNKTMSVRHAPAAGQEQAVNGNVPPQPAYQQQTPPPPAYQQQTPPPVRNQGQQQAAPNPYAGQSTVYQVGEFGAKKKKKGMPLVVKILLIIVCVIWALSIFTGVGGVIAEVFFGSKDPKETVTEPSSEEETTKTMTESSKESGNEAEESEKKEAGKLSDKVSDPFEPADQTDLTQEQDQPGELSENTAAGPRIEDFDWFINFMLVHGDEDLPAVDYILRSEEIQGEWKCLISEGAEGEVEDITEFFNGQGILCNTDMTFEGKTGEAVFYPYMMFEDLDHMQEDPRDPFTYDCTFENMVLTAEGDAGETFYAMFYRDGNTQRGFGTYTLPDGTEWGIMFTR
ncbi:MAG: protein kinase [Lachnospiraceae bacterium]|nr:protein kinase [Lachnospiraceae bacterium]